MGQAKARGSREDRVARAIERDAKARADRERDEREEWERMTPGERDATMRRRMRLAQMLMMAAVFDPIFSCV
jgi:predicted Fe-S protein YdhL (DUF1289 family)